MSEFTDFHMRKMRQGATGGEIKSPHSQIESTKKRRPYGKLSQTVQGWADSLKSPHEKALDKSKRRHEKKLKTAN